ncbi:MAG: condensation domain-containing protein [Sulfitobacter sp.]
MASLVPSPAYVPVTQWQKYVLDEATHPDCLDDLRDRLILANAVLIKPGIDMRRLKRAVQKLRSRHDTLRLRFGKVKDTWQATFDRIDTNVLREIDLGDLKDESFHTQIKAIAHAPMQLIDQPLAEICVIRCGTRGDVLITRVHHAVTDGYGMIILTEELMKLMIGLPVTGTPLSHTTYLAQHENLPPAKSRAADAFWRNLHRDFPKAPMVGRKAKGRAPLLHSLGKYDPKQQVFSASPASIQQLQHRAQTVNCSPTSLLFTGFLQGLCDCYNLEKMVFLTSIGRSGPALSNYAGNHTFDTVLPYVTHPSHSVLQGAKSLNDTLIRAMDHLPADATRNHNTYRQNLINNGGYPDQFYAHQPRPLGRQDRSIFGAILNGTPGQEHRLGPFTLTALDLPKVFRSTSDLVFGVATTRTHTGFTLDYDGISYTDAEIQTLGHSICGLLELDHPTLSAA